MNQREASIRYLTTLRLRAIPFTGADEDAGDYPAQVREDIVREMDEDPSDDE